MVVYLDADEFDFHLNDRTRHDGLVDSAGRCDCEGLASVIPSLARRAFESMCDSQTYFLGGLETKSTSSITTYFNLALFMFWGLQSTF